MHNLWKNCKQHASLFQDHSKTQEKLRIADLMPPDNKLLAGCREKNCPYTSKTNTGSSVRDFGFS